MRIRTKYLLILISLVACLTAVVSIYQFTVTQRLNSEFQTRMLERFEASLTEAARSHAVSLSSLTADSLLEPLFFQDIDGVGNIVQPLLSREEIVALNVHARDGRIFHNGSDELESFGDLASPEVAEVLEGKAPAVRMNGDMTIRIITPIVADGYVFGALDVVIDTTFVESEIAAMQSELVAASDDETRQQIVQLVGVSLVALMIAAAVATLLAARLSAPIQELAGATERISRGDFSMDIETRRNDELGALASSFDNMSRALRETMVSRSELQSRVASQTQELRETHEQLVTLETDRREVLEEISDDLRAPIQDLESDAEHALRSQDSALELRHSMSRLLLRIRDVRGLLEDLRFASRSSEPRKAARRES